MVSVLSLFWVEVSSDAAKNHRSDMARAGCVVFLGLALLLNQLHAVAPCVDGSWLSFDEALEVQG